MIKEKKAINLKDIKECIGGGLEGEKGRGEMI